MPDEPRSPLTTQEQEEQAHRDIPIQGTFSVEYLTNDEFSKRIDLSSPGMAKVLTCWDQGDPRVMYYLDLRQLAPLIISSDSARGIAWITLSLSDGTTPRRST